MIDKKDKKNYFEKDEYCDFISIEDDFKQLSTFFSNSSKTSFNVCV